MTPPLILQPPRNYVVTITIAIGEDPRAEKDLQSDIMESISLTIGIAGSVKNIGVHPVASLSGAVTP